MNAQITNNLIIIILFIGLFTFNGCYRHDSRHHSNTGNFDNLSDKIVKEIELNQNQEKKLDEIFSSFEEKRDKLNRGHELVDEISKQLKNEELDEVYLKNATSEYVRALEEFSLDFITQLAAFHETLTSEQKSKLVKLLEARKDRKHWSSRYH